MITNKGKTIIARSLCEQINDPLAYIAVGAGQWNSSEILYKQQLCFETDRFSVGSSAPFEINQQIAVVLNATMPSPGLSNVWEMGIFTASRDTLLTTNPSTILFTSKNTDTTTVFADTNLDSTASQEVIKRSRVSVVPHEIVERGQLTINVENTVGQKYYEGDLIKYGVPYWGDGLTPNITFVGQNNERIEFATVRDNVPFDPSGDIIQIRRQGVDGEQTDLTPEANKLTSYWVEALVLRSEVIAKIDALGPLKYIIFELDPNSGRSLLIDSVMYESVNTLNPGYAMVAYLAVNTGIDRMPQIKVLDGEEAIISYELLIGDGS